MQSIHNYSSYESQGAGGDQKARKLKNPARTKERDCWRDDTVRKNMAVQMQARRKFKGKDNEKQAILIVLYSPCTYHHPLGRHGQLHIHWKHTQNKQLRWRHAQLWVGLLVAATTESRKTSAVWLSKRGTHFPRGNKVCSYPRGLEPDWTGLQGISTLLEETLGRDPARVFIRGNFKSLIWKKG